MSPFAHSSSSSSTSIASGSGSRRSMDGTSSYDSSPISRNRRTRERKQRPKLSTNGSVSQRLTNNDVGSSLRSESIGGSRGSMASESSRRIPVHREQEWTRDRNVDTDGRWDWGGQVKVEVRGEDEDEVETAESETLDDDLEDRTYRERRRQRREGKRPTAPAQRIFSGRQRTGRRRFRDADDAAAAPINQLDLASLSSPISPLSTTHLPDTSLTHTSSSPLSTTQSHPSPPLPSSHSVHSSVISPDAAHDDALTSGITTTSGSTLLPSSTSSSTVGVVHHVFSPIPIVAGTLAGIIALLAAVVVTIIVTRRNGAARARIRSRRSWLQQQQQHQASIAGGGRGASGNSLNGGIGAGVSQARSRSAGSGRSGNSSRGGRARDKTRERSHMRVRSRSSSNETVSTDGDPYEMRRGPGMGPTNGHNGSSFGGAVDFGARGSVARCFDIPGHRDTRSAKSSAGKVRKKKPPSDALMDEDVSKLQVDVEQGYEDDPHALDSPYIELHIQHTSNNHASKGRQPPPSTVYQYPPPASAYGTMSSASSSLSSPPLPLGNGRSSTHGHHHQNNQLHLPHHRDHPRPACGTSPPVGLPASHLRPSHLMDLSASSISSSSSPPPRTPPPPLHEPQGESVGPGSADVKHPNGPPDALPAMHNDDLEDLPPAYDTM